MHVLLRLIAACLAGLITGSLVNGGILKLADVLLPPPAGVDMHSMAGLQAALPTLPALHFLGPWLAHAGGTLAGAWLASRLLPPRQWTGALLVGLLFLAGGITMAWQLPAPRWFELTDLLLAYLPMTALGHWLAQLRRQSPGGPGQARQSQQP